MDLSGKVAVITGAGHGLGAGIARTCAARGMKLVLAGLHEAALRETAATLGEQDALCVVCDVAKQDALEALATATLDRYGQVDYLFNNAGVGPFGSVQNTTTEEWKWVLSVNLWGPINGIQAFLPIMERQGSGHICTTASEGGLYATPHLAAYNTSKFGAVGLMISLDRDLRAVGSPVTASVFCPSGMNSSILEGDRNRPESALPIAELPPATAAFREIVEDVVANGMDPDEAASHILSGIEDGKFWLFSHPHVPQVALDQARLMAEKQVLPDM